MSGILVIAEQRRGELSAATLETVAAAVSLRRQRPQPLAVAVLARDPEAFVAPLSLAGVEEIVKVAIPTEEFQSDVFEAAVLALAGERSPAVIMTPHSVDAWGYAPAVAVRGGFGCATDVFEVRYDGEDLVAVRAAYAGKLHVEVDFPGRQTVVLTMRGNVYPPLQQNARPRVSSFTAPGVEARTVHLGYIEPPAAEDVDLAQAEFVLAIGRAVNEEGKVEQFRALAGRMGFTLGCSRPIADQGWLPRSRQIGQSGKTVGACKVYLAMGISGAAQHISGMQHVPNVIAVNKDSEAAIFGLARYGVVADVFELAEALRSHFT